MWGAVAVGGRGVIRRGLGGVVGVAVVGGGVGDGGDCVVVWRCP